MKSYQIFPIAFFFIVLSSTLLSAQSKLNQVRSYVLADKQKFGLNQEDIKDWLFLDESFNKKTGVGHMYIQQAIDGIPVRNAILNVTSDRSGNIVHANSTFTKSVYSNLNKGKQLGAIEALRKTLADLELPLISDFEPISVQSNPKEKTTFYIPELSKEEITAELIYLDLGKSGVVLHWKIEVYLSSPFQVWEVYIHAESGNITIKNDQVISCRIDTGSSNHNCDHKDGKHFVNSTESVKEDETTNTSSNPDSYNVYPLPVESPNHGSRVIVVNPANNIASPYGWHDTNGQAGAEYTITRGNNVYAQDDQNGNDGFGSSADGGANLDFDFPINFSQAPSNYLDAALTNLFFWNNIIHDIFYQYGFDETSGNFQENNYGKGGTGGDFVIADGQDGTQFNNAFFFTPAEGSSPRMQMFLWNGPNPDKDGDLDNGIIAHEYGHGISNRLTGGPSNTGCLGNDEQAGEGWSDFFALVLTHKSGDTRNTSRGIGTFALNQPITGTGIRTFPYTTDMSVNSHTYDDIKSLGVPHGVGSVMCATLWDLYWDLTDLYGYDPDVYNGTGGNNIAIQLVISGLKIQPCNPGFMDVRDAILLADEMIYNGANQCLIWAAFARRGMGLSANQGSSTNKNDGTEAFDVPAVNGLESVPNKTQAMLGEVVDFTISSEIECEDLTGVTITDVIPSGMAYVANSASNGGVESGGVITWPTLSSVTKGTTLSYSFQATMNLAYGPPSVAFEDDMESGGDDWTTTNASSLSNWTLATSPASFSPGTTAWFAVEPEANPNPSENEYLNLNISLLPNSILSFNHNYDTELNWDGGIVEISTDNGTSWTNLGPNFTQNGYNDYIKNNPSDVAFSGSSNGYVTSIIDLSSFCGDVTIRFNFYYDHSVSGNGWYVDDVNITSAVGVINTAQLTSDQSSLLLDSDCILALAGSLPVDWVSVGAKADQANSLIEVKWTTGSEINNKGFVVQRRSTNDQFIDIAWLDAQEALSSGKDYVYIDKDVRTSNRYQYRIKQLDYDGNFNFSKVVSAKISIKGGYKIYPNPLSAGNHVVVEWGEEQYEKYTSVDVLDNQGRRLINEILSGNSAKMNIDVSGLSPGIYFIRINSEYETGVNKLIIN